MNQPNSTKEKVKGGNPHQGDTKTPQIWHQMEVPFKDFLTDEIENILRKLGEKK